MYSLLLFFWTSSGFVLFVWRERITWVVAASRRFGWNRSVEAAMRRRRSSEHTRCRRHFHFHSDFSGWNFFQLQPNMIRFSFLHLVECYFSSSDLSSFRNHWTKQK